MEEKGTCKKKIKDDFIDDVISFSCLLFFFFVFYFFKFFNFIFFMLLGKKWRRNFFVLGLWDEFSSIYIGSIGKETNNSKYMLWLNRNHTNVWSLTKLISFLINLFFGEDYFKHLMILFSFSITKIELTFLNFDGFNIL